MGVGGFSAILELKDMRRSDVRHETAHLRRAAFSIVIPGLIRDLSRSVWEMGNGLLARTTFLRQCS